MQIHQVGYRLKGGYRVTQIEHRWDMTPKDAQHRLKILQFFTRYGSAGLAARFSAPRRLDARGRPPKYVIKSNDATPEELVKAVFRVAASGSALNDHISRKRDTSH